MGPKALAKLVADHEGLCKRMVHRHRRQWQLNGPIEDHLQVARMGLVVAAKSWKPDGGSSFPSWAHDTIRWELQKNDKVGSAMRHGIRADQVREIRAKVARGETIPTAEELGVQPSDLALVLEPPEQFCEINNHGACDMGTPELRLALLELDKRDRELVNALAQGDSIAVIAKRRKSTPALVQADVDRVRALLVG